MSIKTVRDKMPTILTAALFLLIPLDYILPHSGSATMVTLVSIVIILYGFIYIIHNRHGKTALIHYSYLLIVLLAVSLLSYIWAINKLVVFSRFFSLVNTFLLYIIIIQFRYDEESIRLVENASMLGALILVVWVYKNVNFDLVYAGYRLKFSQLGSGYFSDPNGLAGRMMFPLIIAINRVLYSNKKIFLVFYLTLIFFFTYILFLTGSRAGIVSIAIAAALFSLQSLEKKQGWIMIAVIIFLLFFYLYAPHFLPQHITERIFNLGKYKEVTKLEGDRIDIWIHVIRDLFLDSPILGYGAGCSGYALVQYYGHIKAVHNSYLMVLCEMGLFGFIPWIIFCIKQIGRAVSIRNKSKALFPAMIAILFLAMTLDALTEKYLWEIFIYMHIIDYCFYEKSILQCDKLEND